MLIRAIDFETTGWSEDPNSEICEVGYTDLIFYPCHPTPFAIGSPVSYLVNPGHPIPEAAQKVHGITDDMVKASPDPVTARKHLTASIEPDSIFAAHYIDFEQAFFKPAEFEWICTWRCAKVLLPQAPRHQLQALSEFLDLKSQESFQQEYASPLHRAGPDSYICAHLVLRLLELATHSSLLEISKRPASSFERSKETAA
ncbi:3'-5' exonuclease [Pseudovibrio sp. Tun.PSC04-5.I4]|uniref:3'-5' exonuclease n=1 Tax=Pseudovibrio sp. Tun.PSC04-5.I4 TaxID=1798213 RepID=UPI00087E2ACF|nr:3'-5' exonuclease [Pseudovibrio sp. Tun.PSC04-5.I4]SDQ99080.1 DNA polymerase III, epsilon subunit [Pseudovibrio sp. Tun.PSC04-5.I4]